MPDLVLKVADPRESKAKVLQQVVRKFVARLLEAKRNVYTDDSAAHFLTST